jgi:hypothetical protein
MPKIILMTLMMNTPLIDFALPAPDRHPRNGKKPYFVDKKHYIRTGRENQ